MSATFDADEPQPIWFDWLDEDELWLPVEPPHEPILVRPGDRLLVQPIRNGEALRLIEHRRRPLH